MDLETGNSMGQDARDERLEAEIASAALALQCAGTPAARRTAFADMQRLHAQRSLRQVDRMEQRAGLAAAAEVPRG